MSVGLSVVLPCRNAAQTLRAAIESTLADAPADAEVIVVDDGSTDESASIAQAAVRRDPRLRIEIQAPTGIVGALNAGLALARGRYIARMDADDVTLPGRFARQVAFLDRCPKVAVVGCKTTLSGNFGDGMRAYIAWQNALQTPSEHTRDLFVESPLCHPSVMMRAAVIQQIGGYREGAFPEDYDLWLRVAGTGHLLAKIDHVGVRWHQHDRQLTSTDPRLREDAFVELKLGHLAPRLRERRPVCIWGAGPTGRRAAKMLLQQGVVLRRFVDIDPAKIGRTARGLPIDDAATVDRACEHVIAAVGSRGAREEIRQRLVSQDWVETVDFTCIA